MSETVKMFDYWAFHDDGQVQFFQICEGEIVDYREYASVKESPVFLLQDDMRYHGQSYIVPVRPGMSPSSDPDIQCQHENTAETSEQVFVCEDCRLTSYGQSFEADAIERLKCMAEGKPVFFDPVHAALIISIFTRATEHIEARTELYLNDFDCLMGILSILKFERVLEEREQK